MAKKRPVTMSVDESFFNVFERARKKEQFKLRQKFGGFFNLSQINFTKMLATNKFRFQIPKQKSLTKRKRIK